MFTFGISLALATGAAVMPSAGVPQTPVLSLGLVALAPFAWGLGGFLAIMLLTRRTSPRDTSIETVQPGGRDFRDAA